MDEEELRYLLPLKEYVGFCDSLKYVRRGERGRGGQGVIDVSCMGKGGGGESQGRVRVLEGGFALYCVSLVHSCVIPFVTIATW